MDIMIKAKELGEMIANSSELVRLKKSETVLDSDEKGMSLIEDYNLLQKELVRATRENKGDVQVNEIRDMLLAKQAELNTYPVTVEYFEAKDAYDALMKNINDIITFAITGEACAPSKCSSCSGCGSSHG